MISHTTERFRKAFAGLPKQVRRQAKEAYKQFQKDPFHPGLRFKRVHSTKPVYSVRINIDYRAVGIQEENVTIWFWIGTHDDYAKLLERL
jgi:mRNA-degrading endonuclease RelE of RelBE toxin-antitoxin system